MEDLAVLKVSASAGAGGKEKEHHARYPGTFEI
jgi:hypothetical protein